MAYTAWKKEEVSGSPESKWMKSGYFREVWMKLRRRFSSVLPWRDDRCRENRVRLQLTGEPPANSLECLVKAIAGESTSVDIARLREQVSRALYREELRLGAGALDIGVWGPALFAGEVTRILSEIRPKFAYLVEENEKALCRDSGDGA